MEKGGERRLGRARKGKESDRLAGESAREEERSKWEFVEARKHQILLFYPSVTI